jgi:subfamily B ATP-binding cassette protein MsbA
MSDVASVQQLITGQAIQLFSDILGFFATAIVILCYFPWYLTALALVMLPFHSLTYIIFSRRVQESAKQVRDKSATIFGSASEVLSGTKIVKSFTAEMREHQSFVTELRELFKLSFWQSSLTNWWSVISTFFHNCGRIVIFIVAGLAVINKTMSVGDFIVYTGLAGGLFQPVLDFIGLTNQFIPAMVGVSRVYEVLETQPEIKDDENAVSLDNMRGEVEFKDVYFKYKTGDEVLHGISFHASPGEVVAIVGPSGSGKSTMANLLARFYEVTKGQILIDGVDIRKIKLRSLREQMGAVLQETFLFSGTIEENIRYGKPEATLEEVVEAAKQANAHDFIMQQPKGYLSEIGEKGVKLSGGQRQRIAIARAILRDPRVLVLDEATSSLDTASELLIQEALDRLMQNRTTFVIAHRLTTIRNANKIIVMNKGSVEQIGTHEELMSVDGLYRTLYEPQLVQEETGAILEPAEQVA